MTTLRVIAAIAGAIVVVAGAFKVAGMLLGRLRQFGHLVDDLAGEPARPGVPARPSLMQRVAAIEERDAAIAALTQSVRQVQEATVLLQDGQREVKEQVAHLAERVDRLDGDVREELEGTG